MLAIDRQNAEFFSFLDMLFQPSVDFGTGRKVTKAKRIFRIEMPNGHGPYNSELPNAHEIYETICKPVRGYDCSKYARLTNEQCGVSDEAFARKHGMAAYACDSMESLKLWFGDKARAYLATFGAKVIEYEIPAGQYIAKASNGEIIFNRNTSNRIKEYDLVSLE